MNESEKIAFIEKRSRQAEDVAEDLPVDIRPYAYLVGAWLWVEFPDKPAPEIIHALKGLGFTWNKSRKVWQHPGGIWRPRSQRDPRGYYPVLPVEDKEAIN